MDEKTIYGKLAKMAARNPVSFHVPGHKNGNSSGMSPLFREMGKLDTTELYGTDNLHNPVGIIKNAQERAASLYGARESFFLVNGTTGGILAAVSAMASPGDKILMQRDCHRSVFHAAALNNLVPVYMRPQFCPSTGRKLSVAAKQVEEALAIEKNIKLVVLTYPTYDGVCSDLEAIAQAVHLNGAALLVDSAHGAHLGFSDLFPKSPLECGADVVVQSTHKTLPAFTQGSILHINSNRVDSQRMASMLAVYQSSSPSYLLMAGIESAVDIMEKEGRFLLERLHGEIEAFAEKLKSETDIGLSSREAFLADTGFDLDQSKLLLDFSGLGISGLRVMEILRKKYEIYAEMAGLKSLLLHSGVGNSQNDFARALAALVAIWGDKSIPRKSLSQSEYSYRIPEMAILPGRAFYKKVIKVPLKDARGMISGAYLMPYPPGIPLVCPGERIPGETIDHLAELKRQQTGNTGDIISEWENIDIIDEKEAGDQ